MNFKYWLENIEVAPHMPELFLDETLKKAKELEADFIPYQEIEKLETWLWKEEGWKSDLDRDLFFLRKAFNDEYNERLSDRINYLIEGEKLKMGRGNMRRDLTKLAYDDDLFNSKYQDFINNYTNFFRTKKRSPHFDTETDSDLMSPEGKEKLNKLVKV
jgi:hypothetical protein